MVQRSIISAPKQPSIGLASGYARALDAQSAYDVFAVTALHVSVCMRHGRNIRSPSQPAMTAAGMDAKMGTATR